MAVIIDSMLMEYSERMSFTEPKYHLEKTPDSNLAQDSDYMLALIDEISLLLSACTAPRYFVPILPKIMPIKSKASVVDLSVAEQLTF